jgi:hypothetical protein
MQAWAATPVADPPRPKLPHPTSVPTIETTMKNIAPHLTEDRVTTVRSNGTINLRKVRYQVSSKQAGQRVYVIDDGDTITIADLNGEVLAEHKRPAEGLTYVGNQRKRGRSKGDHMHAPGKTTHVHPATGTKVVTPKSNGQVFLLSCLFYVGSADIGKPVTAVWDENTISFYNDADEFIASYPKPKEPRLYFGPKNPKGVKRNY